MSFAAHIRLQCARQGSAPALSLGGVGPDAVSYAKLGYHVDAVSSRLHRLGVVPGSIYGVRHANPLTHVALVLALERLGAASAYIRDVNDTGLVRLTGVLSDRDMPGSGCPVLRVTDDWLLPDGDTKPVPVHESLPSDICRIGLTSGSTGRPKAFALTHDMIAKRIAAQDVGYGELFKNSTKRLCRIGLNISFGYRILIRTLAEGGLFCFPDPVLPRCARGLALYQVQAMIGSPIQLAEFAGYGEKNPGSFSGLELVLCVGARLSPALAESLRRHVCSNVMISYASSEAGLVAAGAVSELDLERGEVGNVIPGVEVESIDPVSGVSLAGSGSVGRLRIRSASAVRGYYGDAVGPDVRFADGWFYPGDLGSVTADGRLSITGREDNVVSFGGVKASLELIEAELLSGPAVKDLAVMALSDTLGIARMVAVIVAQEGWSEQAFWDHCKARLNRVMWPTRIVLVPELPRGPSGKLDRQRLPSMVETEAALRN